MGKLNFLLILKSLNNVNHSFKFLDASQDYNSTVFYGTIIIAILELLYYKNFYFNI